MERIETVDELELETEVY